MKNSTFHGNVVPRHAACQIYRNPKISNCRGLAQWTGSCIGLFSKLCANLLVPGLVRTAAILTILTTLLCSGLKAQTAINSSFVVLSTNGGANTSYDLQAATAFPDFDGSSLGSFIIGINSLVLKGAEQTTTSCPTGDITNGTLYYRVYGTGDTPPAFSSLPISTSSNVAGAVCPGGQNQLWTVSNANINILSGLMPGDYYLEVYSSADYSGGIINADNGGANYITLFSVAASDCANAISVSPAATQVLCVNAVANTLTATATITGPGDGPGDISYQWFRNTSNSTIGGTSVQGPFNTNTNTTTNTFVPPTTATGSLWYYCVVTNTAGDCVGTSYTSTPVEVAVYNPTVPTASILASPGNSICVGTSVTFTATAGNAGANPTYQWKINGANVGTNSNTFTSSSLTHGQKVTVEITADAPCGGSKTSNEIIMTVNPIITPSVSFYAVPGNSICSGTPVTFYATPVNGGSSPVYEWRVNNVVAGGNSSQFSSSTLADGDVIALKITSNAVCVAPLTANAVSIVMTVDPLDPVSVSIGASATSICAGNTVNFTANPVNGGTPAFQWKVNGNPVGANSSTYSSSTLANGSIVTVEMTSDVQCPSVSPAVSNPVNITVNPNLPVSVTVAASASTICTGTSVTFTATPTNGGASPVYQWKVNGGNVGSNSNTYSSSSLANGDIVTVELTSSLTCKTGSPATSTPVTMTVNPFVPVSVSIAASTTTICAGQMVTFTATPVNGGSTPSFQWKVNGVNAGTNSSTFSSSSLTNGQVVTVVMTSNTACASGSPATSNGIAVTVNPILAASVSIAASANNICSGTSVTFTATPTNGGTSPSYQWKLNGFNTGFNSSTFTSTTLSNGDIVSVVMTSGETCVSGSPATSNSVTMVVNPNLPVSVSIAASASSICAGTSVTFTATPVNGGTTPAYQWKLNGANVGSNSSTYANAALANGDQVSCVLTSNAVCATGSPATSNTVTMTVNPILPVSVTIAASATTICSGTSVTFTATPFNGGTPSYQWKVNGANVGTNSNTYTTSSLTNGQVVTVVMTSTLTTCVTGSPATSNAITMTVNNNIPVSISINSSATTICAGSSVSFIATPTNGGTTPSYQWKVNGNNVGSNSASYTTSALANGDQVTCTLTSNASPCPTNNPAISNAIGMTVTPLPTITLSSGSGSNIQSACRNSTLPITITYQLTNATGATVSGLPAGLSGSYNSGTGVYTISGTITANTSTNNYTVTTTSSCNNAQATGTIKVFGAAPSIAGGNGPTTRITSSTTSICPGPSATGITFNAPSSSADVETYEWSLPPGFVVTAGANTSTITVSVPGPGSVIGNNQAINLTLVNPCGTRVISNNVTVNLNSFNAVDAGSNFSVCAGGSASLTNTISGAATRVTWTASSGTITGGPYPAAYTYTPSLSSGTATLTVNTDTANGNCSNAAKFGTAQVVVTINTPVTITSQPAASQTICSGSSASFTVAATGTGLTYQWRKGTTNLVNGSGISGATSATLTITGATTTHSGAYNVVVSGASPCTSVTSNDANLTVNQIVAITTQPTASQTVCGTGTVNLSVTATGTGLGYQWRKNGVNMSNGGNISGATSSTLTISNSSSADNATYTVIVSGTAPCSAVTSSNAVVVVNDPVVISTQPATQAICTGSNVTLNVVASGTGLTYQWKKGGINISNGAYVSGATTANLTLSNLTTADAGSYTVVITGTSPCTAVTSNTATLTVNQAVAITTQPASLAACSGTNVSLSVVATGTGLTYQWRKGGVDLSNIGNISGATSATLTISSVSSLDAATYTVLVSGTSPCSPVLSNNAVLTVNNAVFISAQPASQTGCTGTTVNFDVTATGTGLTYQWKKNGTNMSNGGVVSGATTSSLTLTNITSTDAATYSVTVSGASPCAAATSTNAVLTINQQVAITTQPSNKTVCTGGSTSFTVAATGTGLSYQWKKGGVNLVNGGGISGANTATLTINPAALTDAATDYTVTVSGQSPCNPVTSNAVSLQVFEAAAITSQPVTSQTACSGTQVNISVTATGTALTYQWKKNGSNISDGGNFSGTNTATLTINNTATTDAGNYTVVVNGAGPCGSVTSGNSALSVNQAVTITSQPAASQTTCSGNAVSFSVSATGAGLTYQWKKAGVNLVNDGRITGATSAILNINPALPIDAASDYTVVISGQSPCASVTSNNAALAVNESVVIYIQPSSQTVCSGSNVTFTAAATGDGLTYQWRKNGVLLTEDGNTSGVNTPVLTLYSVNLTAAAAYSVVVNGLTPCAQVTSSNATLTINSAVTITTQPANTAVCSTYPTSISVAASGAGLGYQWYKGPIGSGVPLSNDSHINGVTSSTLNFVQAGFADDGDYYVVVSGASPCSPVTSNQVNLNIDQAIVVTTQPVSQTVCAGASNISFSVVASAGGDALVYQWRKNGVNIPGANSATYTIATAAVSDAGNYDVFINGPTGYTCSSAYSAVATFVVNAIPTAVPSISSQTICSEQAITNINITGNVPSAIYTWTRDNAGSLTGIAASGTGNISGNLTNTTTGSVTTTFTITPSGSGCTGIPVTSTVLVHPKPTVSISQASQSVCNGSNIAPINMTGTVAGTTFNWVRDNTAGVTGIAASGSGNITGTLTNQTTSPITVTFTITPSTINCSGVPVTATVVVNPVPNIVATPSETIICSYDNLTVSLSGNTPGTAYNYTAVQSGVTGASNGSTTSSSFLQTLYTTGSVNGTVTYTITPSINGCPGAAATFSVTVKPLPSGTIAAGVSGTATVCQNASQPPVTFTGSNGNPPYIFTYRINGGSTKTVSTGGGSSSVSVNAPTDVSGVFDYELVAVKHSTTVDCAQPASGHAYVTVNPLPLATISGTTSVCNGAAAPLITFTGSNSTPPYKFTYNINGGASQQVTTTVGNTVTVAAPTGTSGTFTYNLLSVSDGSSVACSNTQTGSAVVTIVPNSSFTLTSAAGTNNQTVCINTAITNTTFLLGGSTAVATITGLPTGVTGVFNNGTKVMTISGTPSVSGTFTYTISTVWSCGTTSTTGTIIVKPVPVGGTASTPSSILACSGSNGGTITLSGYVGNVSKWQRSIDGGLNWVDVSNTTAINTYSNLTQTTWFRAMVVEPACVGQFSYSSHSSVNVVRQSGSGSLSGISDPAIICTGSSTLTASGFGTPDNTVGRLDGGEFDLAGNGLEGPGLWRKMINGTQVNIEASADNTISSPFNLTNGPKSFLSANPACSTITYNNSPLGGVANNNKFMTVIGPNTCTLETPIFNLLGLTSASIDWWESYTLTAGSSIKMELSTDAGVTYNTLLKTITGPAQYSDPLNFGQATLNLSAYVGLSNLRVRFTYTGATCSSWGLDKATITKGFVPTNYTWALYYPLPAGSNPNDHYLNVFTNQSVTVTPPSPNYTNAPITYQYSIISSAGGCAANINVVVNPVLVTSASNPNAAICSGSAMSAISFNSNVTGTTYSWVRDKTTEVTGLATSGTSSSIPTATLVNTTNSPQTVTFTIYPTNSGACNPQPFTTTVVVNPIIPVTISGGGVYCSGTPGTVTLTSAGPFPISVTLSNGVTYTMNSSPRTISVSPSVNTTYTITALPGNCAPVASAGSAAVTFFTNPGITGTWICNSGDGDWFNPCNWANYIIPTNNIDVIISSSSSTCNPVIDPTTSWAAINGPIARSRNITISGTRNLSFRNGGNLYVAGNWFNQVGPAGFTANTGTVTFMGNSNNTPSCASQTINTTGVNAENYYNLVINNSCIRTGTGDNVFLNNPVNVSGVFTLINGITKTSLTNLLTITNNAVSAVVGGATNTYVNGPMMRHTNSTGNYAYPVGKPVYPYAPYRPAIVAPATSVAGSYRGEYMAGTATPTLANRLPVGILNTEYWPIYRTPGSPNAVIKLIYINPNDDSHWTSFGPSTCWYCNVAVVKSYAAGADYWFFTNFPGTAGFNTSTPETIFWQDGGLVSSQMISEFINYNFTFGYDANTILPVSLLSFDGKLVNEDARLTWNVADSRDVGGFELQYSRDGLSFNKLADIYPTSGTRYDYTHTKLLPGQHYYRLLVKDKSGRGSLSKTVLLTVGRNITIIKGMKATVALGTGYIEVYSAIPQKARVQILDMTGRLLDQQTGTLLQGDNSMPVRLLMLPQGMYNLHVTTDDGVIRNLRLMKE